MILFLMLYMSVVNEQMNISVMSTVSPPLFNTASIVNYREKRCCIIMVDMKTGHFCVRYVVYICRYPYENIFGSIQDSRNISVILMFVH